MIGSAIFRADTGSQRGIGHYIRSLSLASHWVEKGGRAYIVGKFNNALAKKAKKLNVVPITQNTKQGTREDLFELKSIRDTFNGIWVCLDGYDFDPDFVSSLRSNHSNVLQFADGPKWPIYCPNILIDQNLGSEKLQYPIREETMVLLGTSYIPIDSSFRGGGFTGYRQPASAKHVLITMGGSDPKNRTELVLESVSTLTSFNKISVILGPNFQYTESLTKLMAIDDRINLIKNPSNMSQVFEKADIVVSSAGITSYEISIVGKPMILIAIVKNQVRNAISFQEAGMSYSISRPDLIDKKKITELVKNLSDNNNKRTSMVRFMREAFDVNGGDRVINKMLKYKNNVK